MRDFDRVRDKIEILLEPRQVALLAAGTMLLCGGIFAVGFGVGRHSAPTASTSVSLRALDAASAVVAAAGPTSQAEAPLAVGEVEFLFPNALSSRPARPAAVIPSVRNPAPGATAREAAPPAPTPATPEPASPGRTAVGSVRAPLPVTARAEPAVRSDPAPAAVRAPRPTPEVWAAAPVAPAPRREAAAPRPEPARARAFDLEDEAELEERSQMNRRGADLAPVAAPARSVQAPVAVVAPAPVAVVAPAPASAGVAALTPLAPRRAEAARVEEVRTPLPPAAPAVSPASPAASTAPSTPPARVVAAAPAIPKAARPAAEVDDGRPRYTLQLKAAKSQEEVDAYLRDLSAHGVKAHTVLANVPGKGRVYRIRVGRFASRVEARKFQEDMVRKSGLADGGFITDL